MRTLPITPSCSSRACATPKAPGRESPSSLSTGRSRSFETFSVSSNRTAIGSSIRHTSKFRRSKANPSLPLRWRSCLPAATVRNVPRCTDVPPTGDRSPSFSMWRRIWCECVRHSPSGSRYWIPRSGSFISQREVSTRCSPPMSATSTVSTPTALCSMSCTPSRTASSLMS